MIADIDANEREAAADESGNDFGKHGETPFYS